MKKENVANTLLMLANQDLSYLPEGQWVKVGTYYAVALNRRFFISKDGKLNPVSYHDLRRNRRRYPRPISLKIGKRTAKRLERELETHRRAP